MIFEVYSTNGVSNMYLIKDAIDNILCRTKPYQVTLFVRENEIENSISKNTIDLNSLIQHIAIKKAIIIIKNPVDVDFRNYVSPRRSLLDNPRRTLFISVLFVYSEEEVPLKSLMLQFEKDLGFLINTSPRRTRPNCLFILVSKTRVSKLLVRRMLHYAWKKKFLDFTILQYLSRNDACKDNLIYSYSNPFTYDYFIKCYVSGDTMYPNKLMNMNGHQLLVALIRRPPVVNFDIDPFGNPKNINGSDYGPLLLLSEFFNFTVKWISPAVKSYSEPIPQNETVTIVDLITQGDVDLGANQVYLHLALRNKHQQGERSIDRSVDEYCLLVPVYQVPVWEISYSVIVLLLDVLIHVSYMYVLVKILKYNLHYWAPHHILQIILGIAATNLPIKTRVMERVFYIMLIVSSLQYSMNLYAKLTDISLLQSDQGPFHTFDDIGNSNLTLEMHAYHKSMTFSHNREVNLERKVKIVEDIMNCPERLLHNKNVACFMDKSIAQAYILDDARCEHQRMKIMKPSFWSAPKGNIFSEASPYVVEFNKVLRRIFESGLSSRWSVHHSVQNKHGVVSKRDILYSPDRLLRKKLIIVLLSGFVLSCIAFISEFITEYFSKL